MRLSVRPEGRNREENDAGAASRIVVPKGGRDRREDGWKEERLAEGRRRVEATSEMLRA